MPIRCDILGRVLGYTGNSVCRGILPCIGERTYYSPHSTLSDALFQRVIEHLRVHAMHAPRSGRPRLEAYRTFLSTGVTSRVNLSSYIDMAVLRSLWPSMPPPQIGIGADPEFVVVGPQNTVKRFQRGNTTSPVGTDGDGYTGELRPIWSPNPLEVFNRLDTLVTEVAQYTPSTDKIVAGEGISRTTGGHIHVSGKGPVPSQPLLAGLDKFITVPLESVCGGLRRATPYGEHSSYRTQSHGGWEYRSPPSWLAHPILTKGALVITHILARSLTLPSGEDELADMAETAEERVAVDGFYAFITALKAKNTKLEELDVLRTWGKRRLQQRAAQSPVVAAFPVVLSSDANMPTELTWPREVPVGFVGAAPNRGNRRIFLPSAIFPRFHHALFRTDCEYVEWEHSTIGVSADLRNSPQATAGIIREILTILYPIEGDNNG